MHVRSTRASGVECKNSGRDGDPQGDTNYSPGSNALPISSQRLEALTANTRSCSWRRAIMLSVHHRREPGDGNLLDDQACRRRRCRWHQRCSRTKQHCARLPDWQADTTPEDPYTTDGRQHEASRLAMYANNGHTATPRRLRLCTTAAQSSFRGGQQDTIHDAPSRKLLRFHLSSP